MIDCYNTVIVYSEINFERKKKSTKEHIVETIEVNRVTIRRCYDKLSIPLTLPGNLLSTIHYLPSRNQSSDSESNKKSKLNINSTTQTDLEIIQPHSAQNTVKMPQSVDDFFKMASAIIRDKFEGDAELLDSFIKDAEFIESMTEQQNKELFLRFIQTKISKKAGECLPAVESIKELKDIVDALRKEIKPDSSLIIEGKLATLHISKGNFTKFSEEAGKLAEAYRRSLIFEHFTKEKASELTVRKTKELCRRMARDDVVKSVIDSTRYDNPAEVIATFITQSDIARKEKKEQQNFQKHSNDKSYNKGQKYYNKGQKVYKGKQKGQQKGKYDKKESQKGRGRGNQGEHTIRIVSDAGAPSTSTDTNNTEQVFRLNPS